MQVFNLLSKEILNGELKHGTKFLPQRKMADQLNVSINTVITAYNMLLQYDYVISLERSGYYVNYSPSTKISFPERRWHSFGHSIYNFSKNDSDLSIHTEFKCAYGQAVTLHGRIFCVSGLHRRL